MNIIFINNENTLTHNEVNYWKRMIKSNLKIGIELESCYNTRIEEDTIISRLRDILKPTNNTVMFGDFGVNQIKGDGSLENGVELTTVGRRVDFLDLYNQYKCIIDELMNFSPIMNSRAGLHNHILLDYKSDSYNSLEKPMPGIIFRNFMSLLKISAPYLVWITSTVNENNSITRYSQFCKHDTLMNSSSINMSRSLLEYRNAIIENDRYRFCNLKPLGIIRGDKIDKFHFELRFPDGSLAPAQIAAQNTLYAALILKAIEASEVGLVSAELDVLSNSQRLMNVIRNVPGSAYGNNRASNPPRDVDKENLKNGAISLIEFLKPQIDQFDTKVYRVLRVLAETPVSLMLRNNGWRAINQNFDSMIKLMYKNDTREFNSIINSINRMSVSKCNSAYDWCTKVAAEHHIPVPQVQDLVNRLGVIKPLGYDMELGTYVFK